MHNSSPRAAPRTVHFGPHPDQLVEHFDALGSHRVVLIHGGFWKPAYDREHLRPAAAALQDNGFDVALVEYRRPETGRWPVIAHDVRAALQSIAHETAMPAMPSMVVGHSAGGQLAVWATHQPEGQHLVGAISLAGCLDLRTAEQARLGDGAVTALLGAPASMHPDADPCQLAPAGCPVVLIHGDSDPDVPLSISRNYRDQVQQRAPERTPQLLELPRTGHFELVTPGTAAFATVLEMLPEVFGITA